MHEDEKTEREHLYRLLDEFSVAMIVTHGIDDSMIARPMAIARIDRDGALYFTTPVDSTKVDEILADPHVTVVVQSKTRFAAVRGVAHVSTDRALIHDLWREDWKVWFPRGKDDPTISILIVEPHHAEYWDNAGTSGLKFAFEAARAYLTGRTPRDQEEHGEVHLR